MNLWYYFKKIYLSYTKYLHRNEGERFLSNIYKIIYFCGVINLYYKRWIDSSSLELSTLLVTFKAIFFLYNRAIILVLTHSSTLLLSAIILIADKDHRSHKILCKLLCDLRILSILWLWIFVKDWSDIWQFWDFIVKVVHICICPAKFNSIQF